MTANNVIAIVDPYSSGAELAREVKLRGDTCVKVQSSDVIPAMYRSSFQQDLFDSVVRYQGDFDETCAELHRHGASHVIPGCEMGVELADRLCERLGLISNGTDLSRARRDKACMGETLRHHGVRCPDAVASSVPRVIKDWLRQRDQWPVVIKPLGSSGSDGVQLCTDEIEFDRAFVEIAGQRNVFGSVNRQVLAQEFVAGKEFAIDTVSCHGRHKAVAMWEYRKQRAQGFEFATDAMELLPYDASLARRLIPCVASALDALHIRFGPAHCEVILSPTGPVVVEIGARLNGGNNPMLSRYAGGKSQIDWTLESYLNPESFLAGIGEPYALSGHAMRVFLTPSRPDRLVSFGDVEGIERLPSFHQMRLSDNPGRSSSRVVGWVVLVHEDRAVIHRDLGCIRQLEQTGLYEFDSDP